MNALGGPPVTVAAVVGIGALATFGLGVEPAIATQLGSQLALAPPAVATVLTTELAASMLAALPAFWWNERMAPRAVAIAAGLLFVGANLYSAWTSRYDVLLATRAFAGFANGTLLILVLAVAGRCAIPERVYGSWVVGQTLASAVGLVWVPRLFERFGLSGIYLLVAVAMSAALFLVRGLPPQADDRPDPAVGARAAGPALAALAVLFLFYVCVGGIWAFAADRGIAADISRRHVAAELGIANLFGIAGALLATAISRHGPSLRWALLGHAVLAGAFVLFATAREDLRFAASIILLQFAWAFSAPFLLARVAACGPSGRMMCATNVALGAGLSVGPMLVGVLLEQPGRFALAAGATLLLLGGGAALLVTGPQPQRGAAAS